MFNKRMRRQYKSTSKALKDIEGYLKEDLPYRKLMEKISARIKQAYKDVKEGSGHE